MNANWIKAGLREIKRTFQHILDDGASYVIDEAIAELEATKKAFDELQGKTHHPGLTPEPWGYRIYPESPLRFKRSNAIKGLSCWVDLYCTVLWWKEGSLPVKQEITLRVWSDELDYIYRPAWDSEKIYGRLTLGRVMLRCHFDLANPNQHGPKYHLQFGGNAREHELCWFPEIMDLPRLACPPMDLILACQLIAANFYREEYDEFRETPEWIHTLRTSQEHLFKDRDGSPNCDRSVVVWRGFWSLWDKKSHCDFEVSSGLEISPPSSAFVHTPPFAAQEDLWGGGSLQSQSDRLEEVVGFKLDATSLHSGGVFEPSPLFDLKILIQGFPSQVILRRVDRLIAL